jgi:hypothetical protein
MAVIVGEFDLACKVEAGDQHSSVLGEAGGGAETETMCLDAIDSAGRIQVLHALLLQGVHRALVVAHRREKPLFAFKENGDIGGQRLAVLPFIDSSNAEDQADAPSFVPGWVRRC